MKGIRIFYAMLAVIPLMGQQVQRSFVAFENYFEEIAATEPHAVIRFSASAQDEYDVAVRVTTIDGTAIAGRDYVPLDTEIVFTAGSPTRTREIQVQLIQNDNPGDRTFRLKLNASFPAEVSRLRGEIPVTITANPPLVWGRNGTNLAVKWRASANLRLESAGSLTGPWVAVTNTPAQIPDTPDQVLSLPIAPTNSFFRLAQPKTNQ